MELPHHHLTFRAVGDTTLGVRWTFLSFKATWYIVSGFAECSNHKDCAGTALLGSLNIVVCWDWAVSIPEVVASPSSRPPVGRMHRLGSYQLDGNMFLYYAHMSWLCEGGVKRVFEMCRVSRTTW